MKSVTLISIIFFSLLLSVSAFAQQPRIDSISVDEAKGELVLHGSFQNSASAVVLVDSASLPVTLASDTLIRATIPATGKGSAGNVMVVISGMGSNQKLLSFFHFEVYDQWQRHYSGGGLAFESSDNFIHVRGDILDFNRYGKHALMPTQNSRYRIIASGNDATFGFDYVYKGAVYDSAVIITRPIIYDADNRDFIFGYWVPSDSTFQQFPHTAIIKLDLAYQVIHDHGGTTSDCINALDGPCSDTKALSPTGFPPPPVSGVGEISQSSRIFEAYISANPIIAGADIILKLQQPVNMQMEIVDILGHLRYSDERTLPQGESRLRVNISVLPTGAYICRLQAGGEVKSIRFVKE